MLTWLAGIKTIVWLVLAGGLVATALGFGIRRYVLEHLYKKSVIKNEVSFSDCVNKAITQKEMEYCLDQVKEK